jgi:HSP20 family protein
MAIAPYRSSELFPLLDDVFGSMRGWGGHANEMLRMPDADVVETQDELRVTLDLPGMKADDIGVDLENNVLTISGEKREQNEDEGQDRTWHLSERRYGRFTRSFVLPRDVDAEQIQAGFENGVLTVSIPKSERAKRRRIQIQDGGQRREVEARSGDESA